MTTVFERIITSPTIGITTRERENCLPSIVTPTEVGARGGRAAFHDPPGPGLCRDDDRF